MNGDKSNAEIRAQPFLRKELGVGERSCCGEVRDVNPGGAAGSENVGMSSEMPMKIRHAESPRFPSQRSSRTG